MNVIFVRAGKGIAAALVALAGMASVAGAQSAIITGTVTAEGGRPLEGANVYISELNVSVGTNAAGRYTISLPPARLRGQTVPLRVRSVAYTPQSRTIVLTAGAQTVDFTLKQDINRLNDVVVTGVTGATERAKVPFSVSRVDTSEMPVTAVNPLTQLQGKITGANIQANSGRPGAQPAVLLRGPASINGSGRSQEPLYIVDGIILNGPLPDLNSQDIESVEVVKGAAAASLYGSRAGAGVIQIKTKSGRGAPEGVRFNFRNEYGVSDIERDFGISRNHALLLDPTGTRFCVADAVGSNNTCSRTLDYREEVIRINNVPGDTAGRTATFPVDPGAVTSGPILRRSFISNRYPGQTYNAVDQLVDPQPLILTNLDASGRSGATNFYASVNRTKQGGAIRFLQGFERMSGRVNVGQLIGSHWDMQLNSFYSRSTQDGLNQEEGGTGFFRLTRTPAIVDLTARDNRGFLYIRPNLQNGGVQNENALYSFENVDREDVRDRFIGGGTLRYTPIDWFDVEGNVSYDRSTLVFKQFNNRGFRTTTPNPINNGRLSNGNDNARSYNTSLQTTVRRTLFPELLSRVNFRYLYEQQDADFRSLSGQTLKVTGVQSAENIQEQKTLSSNENSRRQMSFSGGLNLDFKDRYILDGLVRRDGSSLFGVNNRWATYGRISGAWLAAREPWWVSDAVTQFTLRASVGSAGQVPPFAGQYEAYTIGAGGTLNPLTIGNKDLRPEVKTEREVGLDVEVLGRYALNAAYSVSDSRDQILPIEVAGVTGFRQRYLNAGTLNNKTLELSLSLPVVRRTDFTATSRINYTRGRATVTRLDVEPFFIGTALTATGTIVQVAEGERFGTIYGRRFVTRCGQLSVADRTRCGSGLDFQRNSDGYIVYVGAGNNPGQGISDNLWNTFTQLNWANEGAERPSLVQANWGMPIIQRDSASGGVVVPLGHALPDFQWSVSQTMTFKRLTFFGLLDASVGQSVWNQGRHWSYLDFLSQDVDQSNASIENAKPLGYYYRATRPDNNSGLGGLYDQLQPNNHFVEKASFAKVREMNLSYRVGRIGGAGNWTVSVIGRNLYTFTNYRGFDPEVGIGASTNSQSGSAALNPIDAFSFPGLRSFTLAVNTSF